MGALKGPWHGSSWWADVILWYWRPKNKTQYSRGPGLAVPCLAVGPDLAVQNSADTAVPRFALAVVQPLNRIVTGLAVVWGHFGWNSGCVHTPGNNGSLSAANLAGTHTHFHSSIQTAYPLRFAATRSEPCRARR